MGETERVFCLISLSFGGLVDLSSIYYFRSGPEVRQGTTKNIYFSNLKSNSAITDTSSPLLEAVLQNSSRKRKLIPQQQSVDSAVLWTRGQGCKATSGSPGSANLGLSRSRKNLDFSRFRKSLISPGSENLDFSRSRKPLFLQVQKISIFPDSENLDFSRFREP